MKDFVPLFQQMATIFEVALREKRARYAQLIRVNDIAALAAGETHLITEGLTKHELDMDCADQFGPLDFSATLSSFLRFAFNLSPIFARS